MSGQCASTWIPREGGGCVHKQADRNMFGVTRVSACNTLEPTQSLLTDEEARQGVGGDKVSRRTQHTPKQKRG